MATYLWGLPGASSTNVAAGSQPKFEVGFKGITGVNPDEFEPRILRLNPTKDNWRLLGITQMKDAPTQGMTPQWPSYSAFLEETVAALNKIVVPGDVTISPEKPLAPGPYAIVLRPAFRNRKFSAESISKNQGEGMLFNSAWSFTILAGAVETAAASPDKTSYKRVDSVEYIIDPADLRPTDDVLKDARKKVVGTYGAGKWESATNDSGVTTYTSGDRKSIITIQTTKHSLLIDRYEQR